MAKVSSNERQSKWGKHKRRSRNAKNKYMKPGSLAQLRDSRASGCKQNGCTDLETHQHVNTDKSPTLLSPMSFQFAPILSSSDLLSPNNLATTPKTSRFEDCESESRLESLPTDLLVKVLCHLHHDQLRAVFHVSQKIRKAVVIARQLHFNYNTPDRTRHEVLSTITPLPTDHWPFTSSKGVGKGRFFTSPHTPKAPKHGPRPPSHLHITEMKQVAAVLFQDSSFSSTCLVPSVIQRPLCKSLASNRVLFYEEELCQAVSQNKLL